MGQVVDGNARARDILGYPPSDLELGDSFVKVDLTRFSQETSNIC